MSMTPSPLDKRTDILVVPLSRHERRRLDAWAHQQERECSQAIRWLLRDVLAGPNETPAPAFAGEAGARGDDDACDRS
jgi:hypothetical protein